MACLILLVLILLLIMYKKMNVIEGYSRCGGRGNMSFDGGSRGGINFGGSGGGINFGGARGGFGFGGRNGILL